MQQDPSQAQPAVQPGTVPPPGTGGGNTAEALTQMGFDHLIHNFDFLGWIVFVVLCVMSIASWFFIVANFLRNTMIRARMERVIHTFWDTPSAQDAVRFME
jgi:biopolymer transport protein ExbB